MVPILLICDSRRTKWLSDLFFNLRLLYKKSIPQSGDASKFLIYAHSGIFMLLSRMLWDGMIYSYDYGDGWKHIVEFEGEHPKLKQSRHYPICIAGKRACPPEDVGGIPGYENYILAITDPTHEEHAGLLQWRGKYDPNKFNPKKVKFDNPRKRWDKAFAQD